MSTDSTASYVNGTLAYRVQELESDVKALTRKVDKLIWAIVSLSIALTSTSVILVITRLAEHTAS